MDEHDSIPLQITKYRTSVRFFPVHCIIRRFCNNEIFAFFTTILTRENSIRKNDMHCHLLRETLKIIKNPIFATKKGYKSIVFTQNFETSEKPPLINSTYYLWKIIRMIEFLYFKCEFMNSLHGQLFSSAFSSLH